MDRYFAIPRLDSFTLPPLHRPAHLDWARIVCDELDLDTVGLDDDGRLPVYPTTKQWVSVWAFQGLEHLTG